MVKLNLLVIVAVLLYSCNGRTTKRNEAPTGDYVWQIQLETDYVNAYTKSGLLDKVYRTITMHLSTGGLYKLKYIDERTYDAKNNLLNVKSYSLPEKELSEEKNYRYDDNNNCIEETETTGEQIDSKLLKRYNSRNQLIQQTSIVRAIDTSLKDQSVDSVLAHLNDKKPQQKYDTTITLYFYDPGGNCIKEIVRRSDIKAPTVYINLYSANQKLVTYEITEKNDTPFIRKYEKEGFLIRETIIFKNHTGFRDTTWYDGKNIMKRVHYSDILHFREKKTYEYDEKGNVIKEVLYK